MPEDETQEPLPEIIDIGAVATEALELALPLYPRAPGVALGEASLPRRAPPPCAKPTSNPLPAWPRCAIA